MAPKASTPAGTNDQRAATAAANASLDIDFSNTLAEDAFERYVGPGPWQRKLDTLVAAVEAGKLDHGNYVQIGTFKSASGANTAKNGITRHPDRLIRGSFEFKTRVVRNEDDSKSSQLWACVMPDDDGAVDAE